MEGRTFQATIYQPEGSGPFPALLEVHGGQWTIPTASRHTDACVAEFLASWGVVVAAVDFRQDHQHHYPDSVADVNYAMRWLRSNAARFNASREVVGTLGSSSGGHLVMLNAMRPDDPRYAALPVPGVPALAGGADYVIAHSPILNPEGRLEFAKQSGRDDIVRATAIYFDPPETLGEANCQAILDGHEPVRLVPALIVQGTADKNIDYTLQDRFAAAYRAAGGDIEVAKFEGAPHIFMTSTNGEDAERALHLVKAFIARQVGAL